MPGLLVRLLLVLLLLVLLVVVLLLLVGLVLVGSAAAPATVLALAMSCTCRKLRGLFLQVTGLSNLRESSRLGLSDMSKLCKEAQ